MSVRTKVIHILEITGGTFLMALATQCAFDPIGLVTGGFLGLGIIVRNLTEGILAGGIPLWATNLALNIPLMLVGLLRKGGHYLGRTLFATALLSVWLSVIPSMDLAEGYYLLAALFGGIVYGAGMGLVFCAGTSTGGTDMVATLVQPLFPQYSLARILQIIDAAVVLLGAYVFGIRPTLYAVVAIFIMARITDGVMIGFTHSDGVYIFSEEYEAVSVRIMEELDRGVTGLSARGMYTDRDRCLLYCVVSRKELYALKEMIHDVDPNAFVIVTDVREVFGEGFRTYQKAKS